MSRKPARLRDGGEALDLERFEPFLINSLMRRFNGRLEKAFRSKRLSIHDWRLLATLANTPLNRPADIAGYIATDPSTLSRMIDRFVRAGVMVRRKPAGEARVTELVLTKFGHSLYQEAFTVIAGERDRLVGMLTAAEKQQFLGLLLKLSDSYEPATALPGARISAA
ncbi:MAG: MarR family winged helix-turn-helix transcriptional regulator [Pseudorhodoplanes sp.]|uniref:MarR family winged helix-turn-helix transcriptional regulator n=1 Tax=Pseudorhodoplanes sp. TaxID=1934341 RepID=UPI003D128090